MAVFKKMFTNKKTKSPSMKFQADSDKPGSPINGAEVEKQKKEWQDELEEMSDFLVLKSTQEQKEEGKEPVDTCYVEDRHGILYLKAVFDAHHFKAPDIEVRVDGPDLIVEAKCTEERGDKEYTKTMIRKVGLPKNVDIHKVQSHLTGDGLLVIEMPFELPQQRQPAGPNVFPIIADPDGRRKICLATLLGPEFTSDDVRVETNGKNLTVSAFYSEDVGKFGRQVNLREVRREYILPVNIHMDKVLANFSSDGRLFLEIFLVDEPAYKCEVSAEEVNGTK